MRQSISLLFSVSLLSLGLATGAAQAQSGVVANVQQDVNTVTSNVKQDVKDLAHGNISGAHERHKRVIRGTNRRHMTVARCVARYGRAWCNRHGYSNGKHRHQCKTRSGRWVRCARPRS